MRLAALLLASCAACSLGGKPPRYDYFVLTPTRAAGPLRAPAGTAEQSTLAIDQVTIPGYLDREQIATRTDEHHLIYSTRDRWAEPLDRAFERTLRQDLAARLASVGIQVPPRTGSPTYDLDVEVLRFERRGADRVELWARWSLRGQESVLDSGESRIRVTMPGRDNNAMAAALSEAIERMAIEIADRVHAADIQLAVRERTTSKT